MLVVLKDNPQPEGAEPEIDTVPEKSGNPATVTVVEIEELGVASTVLDIDCGTKRKSESSLLLFKLMSK